MYYRAFSKHSRIVSVYGEGEELQFAHRQESKHNTKLNKTKKSPKY